MKTLAALLLLTTSAFAEEVMGRPINEWVDPQGTVIMRSWDDAFWLTTGESCEFSKDDELTCGTYRVMFVGNEAVTQDGVKLRLR